MLRFRTLGSPVVEGGSRPLVGAAAQRQGLALLALLDRAGERGLSRDRLVVYLWPESPGPKARHRLSQLLHALRRDLRAETLFLGTTDLRLNPAAFSSDAAEFDAALERGDLEPAVTVYGGPFLDGFFLDEAPEFERWLELERSALARRCAEALEGLAASAVSQGDPRKAAAWWRRLADHDPLSSRVTIHLMSSLAAAGDRAEALKQARAYQSLLEQELGAAPNPSVLALAARLREGPTGAAPPPAAGPSPAGGVTVAVLPFSNLGGEPSNETFAEGVGEELRSALVRLGGVKVVSRTSAASFRNANVDAREIGRRLGADVLLEGSVRQSSGRLRLAVQLIDPADGCQIWSARFEREVADAFAVQDEWSRSILQEVTPLLRDRAGRSPAGG